MGIPFTQYKRPDGRKVDVEINASKEIEALADQFISAGGSFACEVMADQTVVVYGCFDDDDIAIDSTPNGPGVPAAVDRVVRLAHKQVCGESDQ